MKELLVRALSGAVYVALVLGAAWLGSWVTFFLFLIIAVFAALEWHKLFWRSDRPNLRRFETASLTLFCYGLGTSLIGPFPSSAFTPWLVGLFGLAVVLNAVRETQKLRAAIFTLSLAAYLALPFLCATWMVHRATSLFIGFMLLLWTNDTGAYLVGKSFGRNKLMPSVSPGKTWEGFVGGLILTMAVALAVAKHTDTGLAGRTWLVAAVVVTITGTIGDLFESAMKRKAGVKDSGTIMPGHGGVLDRFDGYLLAAPAMALLILLLE